MKHIRIFANFGFWKPCLKSANVSGQQVDQVEAFVAALEAVVPFLGPFITVEVTDIVQGQTLPQVTTVADVHTQP